MELYSLQVFHAVATEKSFSRAAEKLLRTQPAVSLALQRLEEKGVIELDEERKAAMVSNLLVVLCSEQATQQVVNTGSLYQ